MAKVKQKIDSNITADAVAEQVRADGGEQCIMPIPSPGSSLLADAPDKSSDEEGPPSKKSISSSCGFEGQLDSGLVISNESKLAHNIKSGTFLFTPPTIDFF